MIAEQLRAVVQASPRHELTKVSALLWKAYAANQVSEQEANELAEMIQLKRVIHTPRNPAKPRLGSRPRTPAHLERRRRWAASGLLPPRLACRFTQGESAVLSCVAKESRARGDCRLTHQEVADVVGCSVTLVKNAIRAARSLGLVSIEERRVSAFRNLPSIVRVVSPEWRAWLQLGGGGRSGPRSPTKREKSPKWNGPEGSLQPAHPIRALPHRALPHRALPHRALSGRAAPGRDAPCLPRSALEEQLQVRPSLRGLA